jgi:hypothetical protein
MRTLLETLKIEWLMDAAYILLCEANCKLS